MTIVDTYLKTAPSDANDGFGMAIDAHTIITKLRKLNPRIHVWQQFGDEFYPGKATGGTCMWIGEPGGTSRKITAFNMGQVPEFTQVGKDGTIIVKGWRAIFDRVIRCTNTRAIDIEKAFGVKLEAGEKDNVCQQCARTFGKVVKVTGKDLLCNFHLGVKRNVDKATDHRDELKYQRKVQGLAPNSPVVIPDVIFGKESFVHVNQDFTDPGLCGGPGKSERGSNGENPKNPDAPVQGSKSNVED